MSKKWLDFNSIIYDELIVNVSDKTKICKSNKINLFIDDQISNCEDMNENGICVINVNDYRYNNNNFFKKWIILNKELVPEDLKKDYLEKNVITKKSLNASLKISKSSEVFNSKISLYEDTKLDIGADSIMESCNIYSSGLNNKIIIGQNCKLKGVNLMHCGNNNKIIIGNNVTINGNFWGSTTLHTMESTTINISDDCMISENVVFRTTGGHSIINPDGKRINTPLNINIASHVWIGMNCMILKGVSIAAGCIVGANSVVTHSFNEHVIIAGNPAKVISKNSNFDWKRARGSNFTSKDFQKY